MCMSTLCLVVVIKLVKPNWKKNRSRVNFTVHFPFFFLFLVLFFSLPIGLLLVESQQANEFERLTR